jgi:sugar phosphate isomerase/epimerase
MRRGKRKWSRRRWLRDTLAGAAFAAVARKTAGAAAGVDLRLGGPVFDKYKTPGEWVESLRRLGYWAAQCPVEADAGDDEVKAYEEAAANADIVIAEVGAWSNPLSADEPTRKAALELCRRQLALADRIGARCCVNIAGSRGEQWDGPSPKNLTQETFDMIVETTRSIIDDVRPRRTFYTLETMPWAYPDSPDSYLRLLRAIDRDRFGVHLDPVNLVCSPQRYFDNGRLLGECFEKLGPHIKSCHAKDILLRPRLTTHLDEVLAGTGGLDYTVFLKELSRFPGTPLMLEHLPKAEDYAKAASFIRGVARRLGLSTGGAI